LLLKAIDAKEEGKTVDRDSMLLSSSNQDTKPKTTSKTSRSTSSASSTKVETLSDRAQDPTSRRSIRKRSAPELFIGRPSVRDSGVEEGDEEFLAAFTLTDLRTSSPSSNSNQQSRHSLATKKRGAEESTRDDNAVEEENLIKSATKETSSKKKTKKSVSDGDSSNNKATTTVKSGLKDCPELGLAWTKWRLIMTIPWRLTVTMRA
jgi:hypothetical protein